MSAARWWQRRRGTLASRTDLEQAAAEGSEVAKMMATPGWKVYRAAVEKMLEMERRVLEDADPATLAGPVGVGSAKYSRGTRAALEVADNLVARGDDALQRLAAGRFRGE